MQLRVHCHHLGHTIVGDYTYSSRHDLLPPRMFLHAARLVLDTRLEQLDICTGDPFTPVLPATVSYYCYCSVGGRRARPGTGRWRRSCAACRRGWRCARTRPPAGLSCSRTSDQLAPLTSQDWRRKMTVISICYASGIFNISRPSEGQLAAVLITMLAMAKLVINVVALLGH